MKALRNFVKSDLYLGIIMLIGLLIWHFQPVISVSAGIIFVIVNLLLLTQNNSNGILFLFMIMMVSNVAGNAVNLAPIDELFNDPNIIITLCLIVVTAIEFIIFTIIHFKKDSRPMMWMGLVAILISFAISGVRQDGSVYFTNHFADAAIIFIALFIYLFFSFTLEGNSKEFISKCLLYLGLYVTIQFILVYLIDMPDFSAGERPVLKWGMSNACALIILLAFPAGGYLYIKKPNYAYFFITRLCFLGLMLSTSRGGILCAFPALIATDVYCGLKVKNRKVFSLLCLGTVASVLVVMVATLGITLPYLQFIIERFLTGNNLNDFSSGRIELYIKAWNAFLTSPIIGIGSVLSVKYGVTAWYHSTIFDTLAGLGIVGMLAFGFHFFQKYKFFIKNVKDPFVFTIYIGIVCSGLYGLIDVSYYNIVWLFMFAAVLACLETQVKLETLTTLNK